jgi:hypothetical protein
VRAFAPGLVLGNTLFVGLHFLLGFVVGVPAVALVERYGVALLVGGIAVLAIAGAIGWVILRQRRPTSAPATLTAWADAACPACLGIALLTRGD